MLCTTVSGSAVTYGFILASPMLRDTARTPSTLHRPQWITLPPKSLMRLDSSCLSGLWSWLRATNVPSLFTMMARESPALQQMTCFPTIVTAQAVVPSKWPALTKSLSICTEEKQRISTDMNTTHKEYKRLGAYLGKGSFHSHWEIVWIMVILLANVRWNPIGAELTSRRSSMSIKHCQERYWFRVVLIFACRSDVLDYETV